MSTELQKFYVTYGGGTDLANSFSVVEAADYGAARAIIHDEIGNKFAFCYTANEFAGQAQAYGLTECPLQPQTRLPSYEEPDPADEEMSSAEFQRRERVMYEKLLPSTQPAVIRNPRS